MNKDWLIKQILLIILTLAVQRVISQATTKATVATTAKVNATTHLNATVNANATTHSNTTGNTANATTHSNTTGNTTATSPSNATVTISHKSTPAPANAKSPNVTTNHTILCNFSTNNNSLCPFRTNVSEFGLFTWKHGIGKDSIWAGGPPMDGDKMKDRGGYALADLKDAIKINKTAVLASKVLLSTGSSGKCLTFEYAIQGLSMKKFQVAIVTNFTLCLNVNSTTCKNITQIEILSHFIPLWSITDVTNGKWIKKSVSYSSVDSYKLAFLAIPDQRFSQYHSYAAVDSIKVVDGPCDNDCFFDQDFCKWKRVSNVTNFSWDIGRSSTEFGYGPAQGQSSHKESKKNAGGFAYIENKFPRKAGDKARLISEKMPLSSLPLCMKFWVFMPGKNIVILRIFKQNDTRGEHLIWSMKSGGGEFGWAPCQVTVSSNEASSLRIIFEAEIIQVNNGEAAIDTIVFEEGSCPVSPAKAAGLGMSRLDCSFDLNSCFWKWSQPPSRTTTFSAPMISKVSGGNGKPDGHSSHFKMTDSFIVFELGNYAHQARDSAYMLSPTLLGRNQDLCLSFWALMYTEVYTDHNIGSLSVILALSETNVTLWRLTNKQNLNWFSVNIPVKINEPFQILIKATKGSKRRGLIAIDDIAFYEHKCSVLPEEAVVSNLDCSFDNDACKWKLEHLPNQLPQYNVRNMWSYPVKNSGSTAVYDHTYGVDNGGFLFVKIASTKQEFATWLVSPKIAINETFCFTFFLSPLFIDDTATLTILKRNSSMYVKPILKITKKLLPPRFNRFTQREWLYTQMSVDAYNEHLVIEARMRSGGFAVDDFRAIRGDCDARPISAEIKNATGITPKYRRLVINVPKLYAPKPSQVPRTNILKG